MSSTIASRRVLIDPCGGEPSAAKIAMGTAKYAKESSSQKTAIGAAAFGKWNS
jgi:hypothetical protein